MSNTDRPGTPPLRLSRDQFYSKLREGYAQQYWGDRDGSDIFHPNGFPSLPTVIYDFFCEQIAHDGKVLDLGCGNGLMVRHLTERSRFRLIPYGVDFLGASIRQAQEVILPQFASHFSVGNLVNYPFPHAPYDFIFSSPDNVYPTDRSAFLDALPSKCARDGCVIFYSYRDMLTNSQREWVGEVPELSRLPLERKDGPEVSLGIWRVAGGCSGA
uniref:Methyltransferase domain-containing protein n=1 Tax=Solibacter usitatus (strain Ellin6076) TaxID=234267 RepID=Q023K5_SOLUE